MKIKPDDIEIPCDDPFRHDLLDRKQTILTLTNLLHNLETPYTMSIDASWGNGKTTFLNMWKQHLKNEGFPVVGFSAWDTDFAENPLIALTSELLNTLKSLDDNGDLELNAIEETLPRIHKITLTKAIPWMISLAGVIGGIQSNDPSVALMGNSLADGVAGTMEEVTRNESLDDSLEPLTYIEAKKEINSFRNALRNTAKKLSMKHHGKPLIIAIDELDRCRPSYAVELLEIAKHFFSVDNIVFVLAIDKSQLSHAIRAIYGSNFDAIGYLRRFIDLDFRLPIPERKTFMTQLMEQTGLLRFFEYSDYFLWGYSGDARRILGTFLGSPTVSIRQIQQALHHLGLSLASFESSAKVPYAATAVLVILKTLDPETYRQFTQSNMTDREVVDILFGLPGFQNLKSTKDGTLLEALLVIGYCEFAIEQGRHPLLETQSLFYHYWNIIDSLPNFEFDSTAIDELSTPPTTHERMVLGHLKTYFGMLDAARSRRHVGFNVTVQRLELFSDDLSGNGH